MSRLARRRPQPQPKPAPSWDLREIRNLMPTYSIEERLAQLALVRQYAEAALAESDFE